MSKVSIYLIIGTVHHWMLWVIWSMQSNTKVPTKNITRDIRISRNARNSEASSGDKCLSTVYS